MTEQELKDAITSACEADYKHAMAAPKHRFSRIFRKKIKVLLQPGMGKRTIPHFIRCMADGASLWLWQYWYCFSEQL